MADDPADGESAVTNIQMARDLESTLRAAGRSVEVMYYERGGHSSFFGSPAQHEDEVRRIVAFLLSRLCGDGLMPNRPRST